MSAPWTRSDYHALATALHLSRGDYPRLLSLLSHPPAIVNSHLIHMLLPTHPTAASYSPKKLAREAMRLHSPALTSPAAPPPSRSKRRRGRVAVRVTPAKPSDAAAVRRLGHNPCVEVVLRGVRPVWDVLKHLYKKWSLPLTLFRGEEVHVSHRVFDLVLPDAQTQQLCLTFSVINVPVDWQSLPLSPHEEDQSPASNRRVRKRSLNRSNTPKAASPTRRLHSTASSTPIAANKPNAELASLPEAHLPEAHQLEPGFDPFASPPPQLNLTSTRSSSLGNKRISAPPPAPLEPSFDPFRSPERSYRCSSPKGGWSALQGEHDNSMNPIALHSETTSGTVKRKRMPWGEAGIPTPGERLGMGIDFKKDSLPLPPLPESLDGFSGIADLHGDSIHRKGKIARVVAPEISLTARKERQALEIPPIPALFNSGDLNLVTTSPDGEKAVMKQLKTHLERLENGARDVKTPQEKRTQAPSSTPFTPTNASCSEAAIPETFLKSQSGHDMAFVAKLPDSMFSIGRSEGSGRATQPGSRTSAEESRAFADGNASDGFGFADDSLAGGLMAGTRGGTSTLAVNRSLSFGDVSFGWGSRSISLGTRTLGNASLPDAINSSGNLSGIFREFSS